MQPAAETAPALPVDGTPMPALPVPPPCAISGIPPQLPVAYYHVLEEHGVSTGSYL